MRRRPWTQGSAIQIGLVAAALVVACQWLIVMGFVAHSYTWWLKAGDPVVTAGIAGTLVFSAGSAAAVLYALWMHGEFQAQRSRLRYLAQLVALAGLAGLLVFFGLASVGYVLFVQR